MHLLIGFLFSTSGPIVALIVAAVWLSRRPTAAAPRRFLVVAAAFYVVVSLPIVPYCVGEILTLGYHEFRAGDVHSGRTAIVLLGGGDEFIEGWTGHMTITTPVEGSRVLEAGRVFGLIAPEWIVSAGGATEPPGSAPATSVTMRDELVRLGVPPDRIVLESESHSTRENAADIVPLLKALRIEQVVLVTSAAHMRRAVGAFRAAGCDPVPAIVPDPRLPRRWIWWVLPTFGGLESSGEMAREVGGIPYYWLRGWWR
jgi:uncharacterized SAM-binding protein YcdF (DUF218 family)